MPPLPPTAARLLCVRLDTMGDVLMTGPALRALRAAAPGRRLTLLTSAPGAAAAALMPEVDETIVYEAPWMKRGLADPDADAALIATLADRAFDAAAIFTVYTQSPLPAALLCHLAGVPRRAAHCRENPYALLTDWVPEPEPQRLARHEVRRQLDLVASLGVPAPDSPLAIQIPAPARERARALLADAGVDADAPWAVVHPGATAPSRRYPPESWAEVCRALAVDHGLQLVFTGDAGESETVDRVRSLAGDPGTSLAGRLDVGQLAALVDESALLLAGNTGPVHLAAAVGTPVVDLYALTNPQHTPWMVPSRVLSNDVPCRWCYRSVCPEGHHLCLRGVAPEQVVGAAHELLAEQVGVPPR